MTEPQNSVRSENLFNRFESAVVDEFFRLLKTDDAKGLEVFLIAHPTLNVNSRATRERFSGQTFNGVSVGQFNYDVVENPPLFSAGPKTTLVLMEYGAKVNLPGVNQSTALMAAIENRQLEKTKILLNAGANIIVRDSSSKPRSPISLAVDAPEYLAALTSAVLQREQDVKDFYLSEIASHGKTDVLKDLLANGVNVDATNNRGRTALIAAAENGHTETVQALLSKGANINLANKYGETPLLLATNKGHAEIAQALIAKGADVNMANEDGMTSLLLAAREGHTAIVQTLIAKGANVNVADKYGDTPLRSAAKGGHNEIVQLLITKGANVGTANEYGSTSLMLAASEGHTEIVQALIAKGANVNTVNKYGSTSLMVAASEGHTEIVQALIAKGANVNVADKDGNTPLLWAAGKNYRTYTDTAQLLIAKGANVNVANKDGDTPLLLVVYGGDVATVQALIAKGANVNAANERGDTPLLLAAKRSDSRILHALIAEGADVNAVDNDGDTPLLTAARESYNATTRANLTTTAQALIAKGANVNVANQRGDTTLIWAASKGYTETVQLLLAKGANVNAANKDGRTPLMVAAQRGNNEVVAELMRAGSNPKLKDSDSHDAAWHVRKNFKDAEEEVLLKVLKTKPDPNYFQTLSGGPVAVAETPSTIEPVKEKPVAKVDPKPAAPTVVAKQAVPELAVLRKNSAAAPQLGDTLPPQAAITAMGQLLSQKNPETAVAFEKFGKAMGANIIADRKLSEQEYGAVVNKLYNVQNSDAGRAAFAELDTEIKQLNLPNKKPAYTSQGKQ